MIKKIFGDSLYRNSLFLMMSSGVMAGLGFLSWLIVARLFGSEDVGLATTMISAMGLIASISVLGFNVGLIRFLPKSERKNDKINTAFTVVIIATVLVSSVFLLGLEKFSPNLVFIKENIILSFIFIAFMIVSVMSSLLESIFIAFRQTKFVLLKNSVFGLLRVGLPFALIGLGAFGIFTSYVGAMLVGVGVVFFVLMMKFDYKPKFVFYDDIIKKIGKYSLGNYVAGFIGGLSLLVLPLLITNTINATTTAYYYMAVQIASLLYVIPTATTNSLFAEGSHDERGVDKQIKKSVKIIGLLLIPAIIVIVFFGKYVLLMFGKEYSDAGFNFLRIMALSAVFVAGNKIFEGIFKIHKRTIGILIANIIGVVIVLGGSYTLIQQGYGLMGVAYSYISGQIIRTLFYGGMSLIRRKNDRRKD